MSGNLVNPKGFVAVDMEDQQTDRSMWTRVTDPVFGDGEQAVALRKHCGNRLQPYEHSADHYYPSAIIRVPGMKRYIPNKDDLDRYTSRSRGPFCFDGKGTKFHCHEHNCLPAFIYS